MTPHPHPFYRWKSFWLGLFFLIFLGWAWRDSFYQAPRVVHLHSRTYYQLLHIQGELLFLRADSGRTAYEWQFSTLPLSSGASAAGIKIHWSHYRGNHWAIPDAPILGFSALCFGAFIVARKRRWKHHAAKLAAIAADPTETP